MTRDLVLSILKTRKGYVSGELISKELGLTRAAVNLAVKALRKDGYVILSSTKLGYMLKSAPDRLTSGELLTVLGPERMRTVSVFDTVHSTNRVLSELAYDDPTDGQIVMAGADASAVHFIPPTDAESISPASSVRKHLRRPPFLSLPGPPSRWQGL